MLRWIQIHHCCFSTLAKRHTVHLVNIFLNKSSKPLDIVVDEAYGSIGERMSYI